MTDRHLALVVEDDPATAEDLLEIVASLDCAAKKADNKQTAIELLAQNEFCFVLLDLNIKASPDSIKGHKAHGNSLLRDIRKQCGGNRGLAFWTPILVVSAYAEDVDDAVEMMKDGADDVIRKPPLIEDTSKRIRTALQQAGRDSHSKCITHVVTGRNVGGTIVGFPGNREGRRTIVTISGLEMALPDSSLKILLRLAIAHEKGQFVHQRELGAKKDYGFKGISRLRQEIRPPGRQATKIIDNDRHGGYSLTSDVTIAECDVGKLKAIGDTEIDRLARTLLDLMNKRQRQV